MVSLLEMTEVLGPFGCVAVIGRTLGPFWCTLVFKFGNGFSAAAGAAAAGGVSFLKLLDGSSGYVRFFSKSAVGTNVEGVDCFV